jgi:iron complex transport system permease protein
MAFTVGVHLAIGGLLTQLLTRNPLASPHLFGLHAGASLAVVSGMAFLSAMTLQQSVWFAFGGAALGAALVWSLAGVRQTAAIRMALAGMAVHLLLSSLTEGMMILNQETLGGMMFWLVGSVQNANWTDVQTILPWTAGAVIACAVLLPSIKLLLLDDEVAAGLGQRVAIVRTGVILLVVVLAGSAVALCGPIGFVGLIVPHVARSIAGHRLSVLLPLTGLLGGCLLLYADFASRFIAFPFESPVGILTAVLGGPFFIYLARRGGRQSL